MNDKKAEERCQRGTDTRTDGVFASTGDLNALDHDDVREAGSDEERMVSMVRISNRCDELET